MRRKNWVSDEPVYGLLVDLWGKTGNVRKDWEWYQAMLHAGIPNVPTCSSLLSAFLKVHQLSEAYNLLQETMNSMFILFDVFCAGCLSQKPVIKTSVPSTTKDTKMPAQSQKNLSTPKVNQKQEGPAASSKANGRN
ncbi:pentatricopeptide repeat-containing protein At1g74750-like [Pistacia vera]|uniref:pentatricopeptide repeat-containing protein At1g74750-like n=1 Tax=Pistacia vera TaxID=55513 RepID=UPI001263C447|nr:pentatricopeptide repeat-containing protein At1g74750-like [Pistacia vera]